MRFAILVTAMICATAMGVSQSGAQIYDTPRLEPKACVGCAPWIVRMERTGIPIWKLPPEDFNRLHESVEFTAKMHERAKRMPEGPSLTSEDFDRWDESIEFIAKLKEHWPSPSNR